MSRRNKFLRVLRSVKAEHPATLRSVYEWASTLTLESTFWGDESFMKDFYITPAVKRLNFKLKNMSQGLIGLVGLQGSGKSTALQFLCLRLNKEKEGSAYLLHWTPEALKNMEEETEVWRHYREACYWQAYEKAETYGRAFKPLLGHIPTLVTLGQIERRELPIEQVELMLGTAECRELKRKALYDYLASIRYLFIDLPDYSKKHRGDMTRDLRAIETLWKTLQSSEYETNQIMVLGIQKEMFGGHFFFGKMDIVEIEPLKPSELVEAYKQKWQTFEVITEDALLFIAQLSRGVFRRFLKYLQHSIEDAGINKKPFPITVECVKSAITVDQLVKDMDLELADLFKNKEQKLYCVKLLNQLREQQEVNQRQIAEALDINDMAVSRMVKTLEANGYVKRRRAQGAEWLISLA